MNNQFLIKTAAKAFVVWLGLSLAGFFQGEHLITSLTPYYKFVIEKVNPDYQARLYIQHGDENKVTLAATALKSMPIAPNNDLPAGKSIESSITVLHALVPIVILLTIHITFPVNAINQRLLLLGLAIPALFFVSALTAPLQLLGNLEIGFVNAAAQFGYAREKSWILEWTLLTEGGGRWLIPLLTGIGCGGLARKVLN